MSGNRRLLKVHDGGEGGTLPQLQQNQRVSVNILTDKPDYDTSTDTWCDTF